MHISIWLRVILGHINKTSTNSQYFWITEHYHSQTKLHQLRSFTIQFMCTILWDELALQWNSCFKIEQAPGKDAAAVLVCRQHLWRLDYTILVYSKTVPRSEVKGQESRVHQSSHHSWDAKGPFKDTVKRGRASSGPASGHKFYQASKSCYGTITREGICCTNLHRMWWNKRKSTKQHNTNLLCLKNQPLHSLKNITQVLYAEKNLGLR